MEYASGVAALADVDLDVSAGEIVVLIGPSGCGKSTLLRLLAGLERPTRGSVSVAGVTPAAACRRGLIGVAFQRPALVPSRTALDNVRLTLEIRRDVEGHDPAELLERFGLGEAARRYPHQLSGGMQQRVNIAAAIVHRPAVLLLDEPFGALDELTRERLVDWLDPVLRAAGQTVVLVTHSMDEAVRLADRIVILHDRPGRVAEAIGIHDTVRRQERDAIEYRAAIAQLRGALRRAPT